MTKFWSYTVFLNNFAKYSDRQADNKRWIIYDISFSCEWQEFSMARTARIVTWLNFQSD